MRRPSRSTFASSSNTDPGRGRAMSLQTRRVITGLRAQGVRASERLGEAAVVDGAEDEVAVDALDHVAGALGPVAGRGRGDPSHHLRVAALVDAVLGPRARIVLGARHLDA